MEEVRPGRKMVESGTEKLFYKTGTKELQAFAKEKLSCEKNIGFWLCVFAYLSHHELVFETQKTCKKFLEDNFKKNLPAAAALSLPTTDFLPSAPA